MKPRINIGIIGFGTVGVGTLKVLQQNRADIERKVGSRVEVVRIADLDTTTVRPLEYDRSLLTSDVSQILDNPDIDIVAELIGGVNPAKSFIMRALENGKHVVTANKELIAKEGADIFDMAGKRGLDFAFEASVGGGIPIIRPLKTSLAANRILEIKGIVNGTTNYILTRMSREGQEFEDVLAEAQAAGYAEADPTSDIGGYDARYKIAILASIAFTSRVDVESVYCEGITRVSKYDIECARRLGYAIKLLAIAKLHDRKMEIRVHPTMIPEGHPLASVNMVYNGIYVRGDFVDDVMFYGRGAGSYPTGSAVAGDIIEIARDINSGSAGRLPCTCYDRLEVQSMDDVVSKYYVRTLVNDRPNVLAKIAGIFGENGVSIASLMQTMAREDRAEIVMVTHAVAERHFRSAILGMEELSEVAEISSWIRVEE